MNALSSLSEFEGGRFSFAMGGELNAFSGYLELDESTLMNYKLVNNMLAFINTIPSLITFSIPEYNNKGLYAKKVLLNFSTKDSLILLDSARLDSKELKMNGKGSLDYKKNSIDALLDLKTDIGSSLNKVPLVGYILLGDENSTISTEFKISGELSDPKFETKIAKSIIMAPINIIARTLLLPKYLIDSLSSDSNLSLDRNSSEHQKAYKFLDPKED
jgi:hypothetical protein